MDELIPAQLVSVWSLPCIIANGAITQMTLKIERSDDRESTIFILCGRIEANYLPELEALVKSASVDHEVVLDLGEVRLLDRDAVRFLARVEQTGTSLRNCPAFVRQWISHEQKSSTQTGDGESTGLRG